MTDLEKLREEIARTSANVWAGATLTDEEWAALGEASHRTCYEHADAILSIPSISERLKD